MGDDVNSSPELSEFVQKGLVSKLQNDSNLKEETPEWNHNLLIRIYSAESLINLMDSTFNIEAFQALLPAACESMLQLVNDCGNNLDVMTLIMQELKTILKQCKDCLVNDSFNIPQVLHLYVCMCVCGVCVFVVCLFLFCRSCHQTNETKNTQHL